MKEEEKPYKFKHLTEDEQRHLKESLEHNKELMKNLSELYVRKYVDRIR